MSWWKRTPAPTREAHEKLVQHLMARLDQIRSIEGNVVRLMSEVAVQRHVKGQYRELLMTESKRVKDLGELLPMIQAHVANMRGGVSTPEFVAKELTLIHARMFEIVTSSTAAIEALPKPDGESSVSYDNATLIKGGSGFPDVTA